MSKSIIAYKGFNMDLTCRDFQYEIGKEYNIDDEGSIKVCEKGFHACKSIKDALDYYPANRSRYCKVELSGKIDYKTDDSLVCASHIKILEEINMIEEMIKCKKIKEDIFSEGEEKTISNNFLGVMHSKDNWEGIKDNCHIGSRMLILDGKYNVIWKCVHINKEKGFYFMADSIGYFPMDQYYHDPIKHYSFYNTWLFKYILLPLGDSLKNIFGEALNYIPEYIRIGNKITKTIINLPALDEITHKYINNNFTYYKILHCLDMFYNTERPTKWLQTAASHPNSSHIIYYYYTAGGSGHGSSMHDYFSQYCVCPLICLK